LLQGGLPVLGCRFIVKFRWRKIQSILEFLRKVDMTVKEEYKVWENE